MTSGLAVAKQVLSDHRQRAYLIDAHTGRSYTYGEFASHVSGLSAIINSSGVRPGDRVAIVLPTSVEFVLSYFSALTSGAIAVPVNPQAHRRDHAFVFGRTKPSLVICSAETLALAPEGVPKVLFEGSRGRGGPQAAGSIRVEDLTTGVGPILDRIRGADIWSVNFTSGTTAEPKGVVHSAENLLGNAHAFNISAGVGPESRFLHVLPMYYMAGFLNSLICPFVAGGSVVLAAEFNPASALDFWSVPIRHGVNAAWMSPAMLAVLTKVDRDQRAAAYCQGSIRYLFSATAPLSVKTKREFESKYGIPVRQSYGTTEQLLITLNDPGAGDREDAVGRPIGGVRLRLAGEGGAEPGAGNEGEVLVSSPYTYVGYYGPANPQLASRGETEWITTGDLGAFAASGELVITGRKKDLIIKGGVNISPVAVETALRTDPNIDECVAVGVPHDIFGEVVAIAFRPAPGKSVDETVASVKRTLAAELSLAQRPSYLLPVFEFPATVTGKIQRNKVREYVMLHLQEAFSTR